MVLLNPAYCQLKLNYHLFFCNWSFSLVRCYPTIFRNGGLLCFHKGRCNTENRVRKHLSCIAQVFFFFKAATVRNSHFMNQSLSLFSAMTEWLVHKGYCLTKVTGKSIKWTKLKILENLLKNYHMVKMWVVKK